MEFVLVLVVGLALLGLLFWPWDIRGQRRPPGERVWRYVGDDDEDQPQQ